MKKYLIVFALGALLVGCSSPATESETTTTTTTESTSEPGGAMSAPAEGMKSTP
ncbi:hypothetical protein [Gloeobacter violaceus]|uniref:hypothetical protein n=1 Tax=Gloeobacter violaceus TaxID=33072 RepID=UPI0002F9317A|nr:hypothetical protein [Gloeobacter violaceus]